jgi:hypothetical protein
MSEDSYAPLNSPPAVDGQPLAASSKQQHKGSEYRDERPRRVLDGEEAVVQLGLWEREALERSNPE